MTNLKIIVSLTIYLSKLILLKKNQKHLIYTLVRPNKEDFQLIKDS